MPTLLTDRHHLPLHPFTDFGFFKELKRHNIPIGLFYRDVYWAFDLYKKSVSTLKRVFAVHFYKYDLKQYDKFVDTLFLPSLKMLQYIPGGVKIPNVQLLPSGCEIYDQITEKNGRSGLNILYIGGITQPLYDLTPLIEAVRGGLFHAVISGRQHGHAQRRRQQRQHEQDTNRFFYGTHGKAPFRNVGIGSNFSLSLSK